MKLEQLRAKRDTKIARLLTYFGVVMAIFYFVMGLTFWLMPQFDSIPSTTRYSVSGLLVVYGIYRLYRIVKTIKQPTELEENDD